MCERLSTALSSIHSSSMAILNSKFKCFTTTVNDTRSTAQKTSTNAIGRFDFCRKHNTFGNFIRFGHYMTISIEETKAFNLDIVVGIDNINTKKQDDIKEI